MDSGKTINLVLEGGGVKGLAFVGALRVLTDQGYTFSRLAGTSAGAIVASLVAAGYTAEELEKVMRELDYREFADESFVDKLGIPGKSLSVLFEKGIYEGKITRAFVSELLAAKGVRTFADLKISGAQGSIESQYKFVAIVTDVTRGKLVRLPWDYAEYGLDPDTQLVADAVAASAAIPFYYEPARLGKSFVVDGGIISNFPIWIFEGTPHHHATDIPTFGVKLSGHPEARNAIAKQNNTSTTWSYAFSILKTMISAQDQIHLNDPCTLKRTIFVDAGDIAATDFDIPARQQRELYQAGMHATEKFLGRWDFQKFLSSCKNK